MQGKTVRNLERGERKVDPIKAQTPKPTLCVTGSTTTQKGRAGRKKIGATIAAIEGYLSYKGGRLRCSAHID